jgi:uncharacterized protein (DUF1778 family)
MNTNRISVNIKSEDHRLLKSYCASAGITIKDFVLESVLMKIKEKINHGDFKPPNWG